MEQLQLIYQDQQLHMNTQDSLLVQQDCREHLSPNQSMLKLRSTTNLLEQHISLAHKDMST